MGNAIADAGGTGDEGHSDGSSGCPAPTSALAAPAVTPATEATQDQRPRRRYHNIAGINPATNSIIANISVGTSAGFSFEQVAVSPAGPAADDVYVVNDLDGTVSVIGPG